MKNSFCACSKNSTATPFVCLLLIVAMITTCFTVFSFSANAAETTLGELRISKAGGLWEDYTNKLILITPGSTVTGLYYHKLYAVFDSSKNAYVVKDKVSSHRAMSIVAGNNAFGLCFNYTPGTAEGRNEALANFETWCKIREGDLITMTGVDLNKKTIQTSGTWGKDFVSNAVLTVKTTRTGPETKTVYTDKTIVALGDSVTSNGGWTEKAGDEIGGYIINAGCGGDRTDEALMRFNRDVASKNPDIVLIMFGINDVIQYVFNENSVVIFKNNLKTLYDKCIAIGATVIFMSPTNIRTESLENNKFSIYGGLEPSYRLFIKTIEETAEQLNAFYIDNNSLWSTADAASYVCDSVHPNAAGYDMISDNVVKYLTDNSNAIVGETIDGLILKYEYKNIYKNDNGWFLGLSENTSASFVIDLFSSAVSVVQADGKTPAITIGTGCKIMAQNGESTVAVIKGDIDGDGMINAHDYLCLKFFFKAEINFTDSEMSASDVNGDGRMTATDYLQIKRHIIGTYKINFSV